MGLIACFFVFIYHIDLQLFGHGWSVNGFTLFMSNLIKRKAFFALAIVGAALLGLAYAPMTRRRFAELTLDRTRMAHLIAGVGMLILLGLTLEKNILRGFGMMWLLSFLALVPLEWIFQVISRLRSKRNFIYLLYVLICLLDSHFEGRVRITAKFFKNTPSQSHISTN